MPYPFFGPPGPEDPKKPAPYVDPRLAQYRPLLDSLSAISGAPDSVVQRRLNLFDAPGRSTEGYFDPKSATVTLAPNAQDPRRVLQHEYGHIFMQREPDLFYQYLQDVLKQQPQGQYLPDGSARISSAQAEPFADTFADAYGALARGDTLKMKPGVSYLVNLLRGRAPFAKP